MYVRPSHLHYAQYKEVDSILGCCSLLSLSAFFKMFNTIIVSFELLNPIIL